MNQFEERLWRKVFSSIGLLRVIESNVHLGRGSMHWSAEHRILAGTVNQLKALGVWQ